MTRPHSPPTDALAPGQRIGPFVLLAPLGAGGSGRIWAAARLGQLGFNKRMVLKVMREDRLSSASARRRFDREACLGGLMCHPNLRAVHDLGSHDGRPYMALSWVDASLAELLQHAPGERLAPEVACWIAMQCCSGLTAAHGWVEQDGRARAIVHRDVSPGNILLSVDGHALLADLAAPEDESAERTPRFFGNLAYAAPEALRQQALDGRADQYSLGCVLFEMLAGAPAFEGDDERAVMFQILERGAPELSRRAPAVPARLAEVVQRCLARQREERFESTSELRAALSACCQERTAFSLERQTAAFIRDVLGARIREREEMMHAAFERYAPSPLGRTDTLPIGHATTRIVVSGASSAPEPSVSGAAVSLRNPALGRWPALAVLFGLVLLVLVYASSRRPVESVVTQASRATPDVTARSPAPGAALPSAPSSGNDGNVSAPASPEPAGARDVHATDAGPRAPTTSSAPAGPGASRAPESTPRSRDTPARPGSRAAGARSPATVARPDPARSTGDPFDGLKPESNPYAAIKAQRDAAKAAGAPREPPPSTAAPAAPAAPPERPQN